MNQPLHSKKDPGRAGHRITVWDLPTRIFHWTLVTLVGISLATGYAGGNWMLWHVRSGTALLALLGFRLAWGVVGGRHARFISFVRGPSEVWRYAASLIRKDAPRHLGHNPMGGWSVLAMLGALLVQVVTGLFANDDIFTEGPLYPLVSKATSDMLTGIHEINQGVLITLIVLHLGAIFFYLVVKRDNLIGPMITGRKDWPEAAPASEGRLWLAAVIAAVSAAGVFFLVR
ncbi:MAG: cytochrome b/b6 domain-containing protein [Pseudomonadota bacterium]